MRGSENETTNHYRPPLPTIALEPGRALRMKSTDDERALWRMSRGRQLDGLELRRQHPIPPHTVDFFCATTNLVVEPDGSQHSTTADAARTSFLESKGFHVLSFWNNEV